MSNFNNNLLKINDLFLILKEHNHYASDLSKWIKTNNIGGFSRASITLIKQGNRPNREKELIKHLSNYIEAVKNDQTESFSQVNLPLGEKILSSYLNQSFYLYHFDKNEENEELIGRVVIRIGENSNSIIIENIPSSLNTKYTGRFNLLDNQHLQFSLFTTVHHKPLQIIFIIPMSDRIPEILLGVYTNLDAKGALLAGTVVLEHLKGKKKENIFSSNIKYSSEEYLKIPKEVKGFLKDKNLNRIKVTTGIYSLNSLGNFIVKHKK